MGEECEYQCKDFTHRQARFSRNTNMYHFVSSLLPDRAAVWFLYHSYVSSSRLLPFKLDLITSSLIASRTNTSNYTKMVVNFAYAPTTPTAFQTLTMRWRNCSSSSPPSTSALSASPKANAQCAFCRAVSVGCSMR